MPKITELYAFIAEDVGPNDEGIAAFWSEALKSYMPLIGADLSRVDSLRRIAQDVVTATGKAMTLCRYSVREDIERIEP